MSDMKYAFEKAGIKGGGGMKKNAKNAVKNLSPKSNIIRSVFSATRKSMEVHLLAKINLLGCQTII